MVASRLVVAVVSALLVPGVVAAAHATTPDVGTAAQGPTRATSPTTAHARSSGIVERTHADRGFMRAAVAGRVALPKTTALSPQTATTQTTRIAGLVTDPAGHPLANVVVSTGSFTSFASGGSGVTDGTGHYSVPTLPGSEQVLFDGSRARGGSSDATGYYGVRNASVAAELGRTTGIADLVMHPAAVVTGVVTDTRGHGLSGATPYLNTQATYVYDEFDSGYAYRLPGTSVGLSRDGHFRITGVMPGAYSVCFDTDSHPVSGGSNDRAGYETSTCGNRSVVAESGHVFHVGAIKVAPLSEGGIVGRVVDTSGRPISGVYVQANPSKRYEWRATIGQDGSYHLGDMPAGSYRLCFQTEDVVSSAPTGFAPYCLPKRVVVGKNQIVRLNHTLAAGAAISGTVTGANGSPLVGVPVSVSRPTSDDIQWTGQTDESGHYLVKNLPSGVFEVCYQTDFSSAVGTDDVGGGVPNCWDDPANVHVTAGTLRSGVDRQLAAAGGISGTVRDTRGRPVRNVLVDIEGDSDYGNEGEFDADTDASGRFTAVDLPPGDYQVCFIKYVYWDACYDKKSYLNATTVTVKPAQIVQHIDGVISSHAPARASVTVVVKDRAGHAISGVDAVLLGRCPKNESCSVQPLTGGSTAYSVAGSEMTGLSGRTTLEPRKGTYRVCLFGYYGGTASGDPATGYADTCLARTVTISKVADHRRVHVTLSRAGLVKGRVVDRLGRPLQWVRVHISGAAADNFIADPYGDVPTPGQDAYTDADGYYTVRSVQPGMQTVCFDTTRAGSTRTSDYQSQCRGAKIGTTTGGVPIRIRAGRSVHLNIKLAHKKR